MNSAVSGPAPNYRPTRPDLLLIAFLAVALASVFPYFPEIRSANELSRLYLTLALVDDHTTSIDGPLTRYGDISDKAVREARYYSDKAPGMAFVALPFVWLHHAVTSAPTLETDVRIARLVGSTLPTIVLLFVLLGFLAQHVDDAHIRRAVLLAYGLGTVATTYSILFFGHQLSAVSLFLCFIAARNSSMGSRYAPMAVGAFAALAVAVEYPNAVLCAPIGVYFLLRTKSRLRSIAFAAIGALPIALLVGVYHKAAFGSPFATGYSFLANSFAAVHAQGFMGITHPTAAHAYLSFFSPWKGLFYYAPFLLLALPGFYVGRHRGADIRLALVMASLSALIVCSMVFPNGGWTVSQRHFTPMVPWLLLPTALTLSKVKWTRPLFAALAVIAITLTWLSTVVWPHYMDELTNPFFDMGIPLMRDGYFPPSLWNHLGIPTSVFAFAVLAAAIGWLIYFAGQRLERIQRILAIGLVVLVPVVWLGIASQLDRAPNTGTARNYIDQAYVHDFPRR